MPRVRKHLLSPSTVWVEDPLGHPVPFEITADDIDHWLKTGNGMLARGIAIPVPKEHQEAAALSQAQRLADSVDHNCGWATGFSKESDGSLWVDLDVTDPDVYQKLNTTIRFVSPRIDPYLIDPTSGERIVSPITHIALTPWPKYTGQEPGFRDIEAGAVPAPVALSMASGRTFSVSLSMANVWHAPAKYALSLVGVDWDFPIEMAAARAPVGGISIAGTFYPGGRWIPGEQVEKASPAEKAKLTKAKEGHRDRLRSSVSADPHELAKKVAAHDTGLTDRDMTSAKRAWASLKDHHGDLALHRLQQLAEKDMAELPDALGVKRELLQRRLAAYSHMLGWAGKDEGLKGVHDEADRRRGEAARAKEGPAEKVAAKKAESPVSQPAGETDKPNESRLKDRWLQGRSHMREKEGLNPKDATHQAVLDWNEQEAMEKKFKEQNAKAATPPPKPETPAAKGGEGEKASNVRVASSIKDIIDLKADQYEKTHGWKDGQTREGFVKNWKKTLKGTEADPETVKQAAASVQHAVDTLGVPNVPVVVRKRTKDEAHLGRWDGHVLLSDDVGKSKQEPLPLGQGHPSAAGGRLDPVSPVFSYHDPIVGTYVHELGHKFHDDNPETLKRAKELLSHDETAGGGKGAVAGEGVSKVKRLIGRYAATHPNELVAESYAMRKHPDFETLPDETKSLVRHVLGEPSASKSAAKKLSLSPVPSPHVDATLHPSKRATVRLSGAKPMADEEAEKKPKKDDDGELFDDAEIEGGGDDGTPNTDAPAPVAETPPPSDCSTEIANVSEALAREGIMVDPSKTPEEFLQHLVTAMNTYLAQKAKSAPKPVMPNPGATTEPPKEEPQMVAMSLAEQQIEKRLQAKFDVQLKQERTARLSLEREAADAKLRNLADMLDGWKKDGYVPVAKVDDWKAKLTTKKLSLVGTTPDSEVGGILDRIRIMQELIADGTIPKGNYWSAEQKTAKLSLAKEEAAPDFADEVKVGTPLPAEKLAAIQKEKDAMLGRKVS